MDGSDSFAEFSGEKDSDDEDDEKEGVLNDAEAQKKVEVNEDGILNLKLWCHMIYPPITCARIDSLQIINYKYKNRMSFKDNKCF